MGLRAWSPFLPGDAASSNTPGSVFEVHVRNISREEHKGTLVFSFLGPGPGKAGCVYANAVLNGRPGARLLGDGSEIALSTLPNTDTAPGISGNAAFTVFFLGTINKSSHRDQLKRHPLSWGGCGDAAGRGSAIQIDGKADRLDWATGAGADAMTADGSFKDYYGQPTIICIRKTPGAINTTTSISINGANQPLSGASSSITPDIEAADIRLGGCGTMGTFATPNMMVGEVIICTRALTDEEVNAVGSYLGQKYGLDTAYSRPAVPLSPDQIDGLCSWFRADAFTGLTDGDPIPPQKDLSGVERQILTGEFTGVTVQGERDGFPLAYALGVMAEENVRSGAALGENAKAWNNISSTLPEPAEDDVGSSIAVDFSLAPDQSKTLRFVLAWYAPLWHSQLGNTYVNTYATHFKSAAEVAEYLTRQHQSLLRRVLAWQEVIYDERELPGWLQDGLVNVLALLAQESFMMNSPDPGHWWGEEGFFCVNESLFSCPQQACIANDQCGEWPVNLLFPELGLRKLAAFKHYQNRDTGLPPSTLGPGTEPDRPWFEQQLTIDGQVYVHMVDRYRLRIGDDTVLDDWYSSVRACLKFMFATDGDGDGLPDVRGLNQYLDCWPMEGAACHVATYWLATLRIAERMAQMQSDNAFAEECRSWYKKASQSLEQKLWNEQVGSYLLYNDTATGKKSDTVVCDQLIGEMFARLHGLPGVLPPDRVKEVVGTLARLNAAATPHGIRLAVRPDGSEDHTGYYAPLVVPSYSTLAPSMVMLWTGDPHFAQLGLEIVRRTWHNLVIRQNMAWDMPCMVHVDGTPALGLEYYHNTMLWAFPLAVLRQDIRTACAPGGFIHRILRAAGGDD